MAGECAKHLWEVIGLLEFFPTYLLIGRMAIGFSFL